MGHMDDDDNPTFTITIFTPQNAEVYHKCTELEQDGDHLTFRDLNKKSHEIEGMQYHIVQE